MTAPDFRPFERKFANTRHLGRAIFLQNEEGEELDVGSESEGEFQLRAVGSADPRPPKDTPSKTIYIEEVLERAHQ